MTVEKVLCLLAAALFGCFAILFSYQVFVLLWLRLRGVRTKAEVVDLEMHVDSDGKCEYYPVVTFTLPDGTEVEAETGHEAPSAKPGSFIYVFYNPRKPTTATAEEGFIRELVAGMIIVAALWWSSFGFAFL